MTLAFAFKFARALSALDIAHLYGKEGLLLAETMVAQKQLIHCQVLRSTGLTAGYQRVAPLGVPRSAINLEKA